MYLSLMMFFSIGAVKKCGPLEVVVLLKEMDALIAEIHPEYQDQELYDQENNLLKSLTEKQRQQYFAIQRKRVEALKRKK
jgi:hypothetical protein